MRPIVWSFILFVIGAILWFIFSTVTALGTIATGEEPIFYMALMYIFGFLFFFSLPAGIIIEIVNWFKRRKAKQPSVEEKIPASTRPDRKYCSYCNAEMAPDGIFCPECGRKQSEKMAGIKKDTKRCPECGEELKPLDFINKDVCPRCHLTYVRE